MDLSAHTIYLLLKPRSWSRRQTLNPSSPVRKSTNESGAVKEPLRHAVEQAPRRWRAGHASVVGGEAATFDLRTDRRLDPRDVLVRVAFQLLAIFNVQRRLLLVDVADLDDGRVLLF